jgi:entry exclusion lipoprotein TrbK
MVDDHGIEIEAHMTSFENHRTSLAKLVVASALAGVYCASGVAGEFTAQYWLDHPAERANKLHECKAQAATIANSPDCVNASRAAVAALGSGTPVYVGAPAPSSAAVPLTPSDQACTFEALKATPDKEARENMASACIRRGTFTPSPKRVW